MQVVTDLVGILSDFFWGPVTMVLLVGTGLYLTFITFGIQLRHFVYAWKLISGKYDNPEDEGEVTHFQALSTALSATIGTGNIAGVGTAIALGGPGALFWMWVTAIVGMATKYGEALLSIKYRQRHPDGSVSGGPMWYIEKGLGWKWLAVLFALFATIASFGIGNMVQANSVAEPVQAYFGIPKIATGLFLGLLVFLVIVGGIKRIARVASAIVPFMAVVYVLGSLWVIFANRSLLGEAFATIFQHAFSATAATGGFAGAAVAATIRYGVARGLFSNEAGLGSAPIAHGAAQTNEPVREGLVAMLGPFIDTLVICTMTGLVIVMTGAWTSGLEGAELTAEAFNRGLPGPGGYIVAFGIVFFAFSTALAWSYYGDRSVEYLLGERFVLPYRVLYSLALPVGAAIKLQLVWDISDVFNAMMAWPNLVALLLLSGVIVRETRAYFADQNRVLGIRPEQSSSAD